MEATDQYSPSHPFTGDGFPSETKWDTYHAADVGVADTQEEAQPIPMPSVLSHSEAAFGSVSAPTAPNPARQLAQDIAGTLQRLTTALDDADNERRQMEEERAQLQEQIRTLEGHRSEKDRLTQSIREGAAGALASDDLASIGAMMDSLKADPDRLTVLFSVVQNASQLASIVTDYTKLRQFVDGA